MAAVLNLPRVKELLSDEHFSVDGTLIQAWASMKSFRRKDGRRAAGAGRNGERNFHKASARTRRMPLPPTRMPGWPAFGNGRLASFGFNGRCAIRAGGNATTFDTAEGGSMIPPNLASHAVSKSRFCSLS